MRVSVLPQPFQGHSSPGSPGSFLICARGDLAGAEDVSLSEGAGEDDVETGVGGALLTEGGAGGAAGDGGFEVLGRLVGVADLVAGLFLD